MSKAKHLVEKFLNTLQAVRMASSSDLLNFLEKGFIYKIGSSEDPFLQDKALIINRACTKVIAQIDDIDAQAEIFDAYNEGFIYSRLKAQLSIERVPEASGKRPDFKILLNDEEFYLEYKALRAMGGNNKYKTEMSSALECNIDLEEQISKGARVATQVRTVAPYDKLRGNYNPRSNKMVIEGLIEKISQNIKPGQYELGNTVLLVDLGSQLPLRMDVEQEIQKQYQGFEGEQVSGILYAVACGRLGEAVFNHSDFPGDDNSGGSLERQGVLREFAFIRALIFHTSCFGKRSELCSFVKWKDEEDYNDNLKILLEYISKAHCFKQCYEINDA